MTFDDLEVAIFSYNRPDCLKNCLKSVRANLPQARIRVFDDNSDDPELLAYFATLPEGMLVLPSYESGESRHGGLYPNMQHALDTAERRYLIMLQDDTQVVREIDQVDLNAIERAFNDDPNRAFLSITFLRGARIRRYRRDMILHRDVELYDTPHTPGSPEYEKRTAYFDISLWNVERLKGNWTVLDSEGANVEQARERFSSMPHVAHPFAFHVPEVPFYRHRHRTLAARLTHWIVGDPPKRFIQMNPQEVEAMRARDLDHWPIAEDFLTPADPNARRPFVYKDVKRHWWLSLLSKVELKLRKL